MSVWNSLAIGSVCVIGKGTGLGLSIVYNIIKQHKGEIEVESRENEGTTFKRLLRPPHQVRGPRSDTIASKN